MASFITQVGSGGEDWLETGSENSHSKLYLQAYHGMPHKGDPPRRNMKDLYAIGLLLRKEFLLELRTGAAIAGITLYVVSTLFVVYEMFVRIQPSVWNTLFWIVFLFVSVNALVKSFVREKGDRALYYYHLLNPSHVLLAKIGYNMLLMFVLGLLIWGLFIFFGDNPVREPGLFSGVIFLGSLGFSVVFTFLASMTALGNQSATLLAVLSFPLVIPMILLLVKISAHALGLLRDTAIGGDIAVLVAIELLCGGLALILFPILWKS